MDVFMPKQREDKEIELLAVPIFQRFMQQNNLIHPVLEVPFFLEYLPVIHYCHFSRWPHELAIYIYSVFYLHFDSH